MLIGLLFSVALIGDSPAEKPVLPPRPVVVTARVAPDPILVIVAVGAEGGKFTDGEVPCDQVLADGTVYCGEPGGVERPNPNVSSSTAANAVTVDNGQGYRLETGPGELTPQDPAYRDANVAEFCEVKPYLCDNGWG